MAELPSCATNAELIDLVRQTGRKYEVIARTIYDLEIVCIRMGGDKNPPIVVTAGAHAGEPAGVYAALALLKTLKTEHSVYVIPLRDPFAWGGFARCLSLALGEEVRVRDHADAEEILTKRGAVLYSEEENSLTISFIGDLVFVSMIPPPNSAGPRDIERRLNRVMRDKPDLIPALQGKRLCWPSNLTGVEGCNDFDRAFSAFVTPTGMIADLNRQFTFAYPPIEVSCVRQLADKVKPKLVLDLHEGQGDKFYLFMATATFEPGDLKARIANAIISGALANGGGEPYRLSDLALRIDPESAKRYSEPTPGVFIGPAHNTKQGASFQTYCQDYSATYSTEPGRWKPLARRVDEILGGANAAIHIFEEHFM